MNKKIVIIVPLRRASVRVPEKIYADIKGLSLSQRTLGILCEYAKDKSEIVVCAAVDDIKTMAHLKEKFPKLEVIITDPALNSGTDRVNSGFEGLKTKKLVNETNVAAVINLQGDMPFFSTEILDSARAHFAKNPNFEGVWTAGHAFEDIKDVTAISCVKALRSQSGRAVYFSRYAIPYSRVEPSLDPAALCHIGIYGYSPKALKTFCATPPSKWEQSESLEQLRALYIDLPFVIDVVPPPSGNKSYRGIDTPEDLAWAQEFAR